MAGAVTFKTPNVELTGTRRQTAMPARSNMDLGVARAWTAAVGGPVERHVRRHFFGGRWFGRPPCPEQQARPL